MSFNWKAKSSLNESVHVLQVKVEGKSNGTGKWH